MFRVLGFFLPFFFFLKRAETAGFSAMLVCCTAAGALSLAIDRLKYTSRSEKRWRGRTEGELVPRSCFRVDVRRRAEKKEKKWKSFFPQTNSQFLRDAYV